MNEVESKIIRDNHTTTVQQVCHFIFINTGLRPSLTMGLEEDLGLTGDEAWIFMKRFEAEFGVDMGAFRLHFLKYFRPARGYVSRLSLYLLFQLPFRLVGRLLFPGSYPLPHLFERKRVELRVEHLVECAAEKRFSLV